MDNTNKFDWVDFYKELAPKLLQYKNNRQPLVDIVKRIFEKTGLKMPRLASSGEIVDIDPFTFYALFNKNPMQNSSRVKIVSEIAEIFQIKSPVPQSFTGIPTIFGMTAMFYNFNNPNKDKDIEGLWSLYDVALQYAANPVMANRDQIVELFDQATNMRGNGLSKVTMGLYWISPDSYLNLDSRNRWYIYESGKVPNEIARTLPMITGNNVTGEVYIEILEKIRGFLQSDATELNNFVDLSAEAWRCSEEVNEENRKKIKEDNEETKGTAVADENVETTRYWIYSPGYDAEFWDDFYDSGIMAIGWDIGDLRQYSSKDEMRQALREKYNTNLSYMNASLAVWQFANEMRPGDIVFVKKGTQQIIGRGVVSSEYYYDESREGYRHVRKINWTHKGNWPHPGQAVMKTLTDITKYTGYVNQLNALFDSEIEDDLEEIDYPLYSKDDFLSEVYMSEENYDDLTHLLTRKKNIILCGAPGVGKTFAAKRLAYSVMGRKDKNRVLMVIPMRILLWAIDRLMTVVLNVKWDHFMSFAKKRSLIMRMIISSLSTRLIVVI